MTYKKLNTLTSALIIVAIATGAARGMTAQDPSVSDYMERPLKLPQIAPGTACPVSVGANDVVSSAHGYIFGAGGFFFGTGPVYIALTWKPLDRPEGYFDLERVPTVPEGYRLKTPWIMHPVYDGKALVRGARIGTAAIREILFNRGPHFQPTLILRSADRAKSNSFLEDGKIDVVWGWWPTSMILPEPGCYAIQIDTETNSDIVVFEATPPE